MSTKEIIDNGLEDDYVKLVDEQADLELDEAADADKLKQLQDAQKKFNDKTNKAEKSIDKSLNKIDKKSNLIKRMFGKKDESLTEVFAEDIDDTIEDMDSADSYMSKKKFTNGTLAEFDPQSLMNKVAETGYSINTIRENGDDTYFISIHYEEWYGPTGIDNPDEMYYVDVVKETADGKQTREVLEDGTATEIVNILNDWKASVV